MIACPSCLQQVQITETVCTDCDIRFQGDFILPRLARLSGESQKLLEQFVLCGGNLKTMAEQLQISYPTLRKKIDELVLSVKQLQQDDQSRMNQILDDIEQGKTSSQKGIRMIKEMNGEL